MTSADQYVQKLELERERVPDFDTYPFCLPAVRQLSTLDLHPAVTFLIGENGTGKSTILEALAVAAGLNPEGGSRSLQFSSRETHSPLHQFLRLSRGARRPRDSFFVRAESFYNVASQIDALDETPEDWGFTPRRVIEGYGGQSLHLQSHGESFFALFMSRFTGNGFYLLDEPEAALSPTRQMAFLSRLHQLVGERSQFVIATHSPIIMSYPEARILCLDEDGIQPVKYADTEHFTVMKRFMADHEGMLRILLEED